MRSVSSAREGESGNRVADFETLYTLSDLLDDAGNLKSQGKRHFCDCWIVSRTGKHVCIVDPGSLHLDQQHAFSRFWCFFLNYCKNLRSTEP